MSVPVVPDSILAKYALDKVFGIKDPRDRMILDVAALVHEGDWMGAGAFYGAFVRKAVDKNYPDPQKKDDVVTIVTQLVHWCLNNDRYWLAARLLWPETVFDPRPYFTRLVWEGWEKQSALMLMGSASASKSYSSGVWLLLDWVRDPEYTCIRLLGPSEQHLNENLFTHLVNMHQSASVPLPGEVGDLFIGLDRRNRYSSITGVVVPLGKRRSGRLQGAKAGNKKRKKPHPKFGILGRLRVFMDESEKIPEGIWLDVDNIFSNLSGVETFKIGCAYNPENQNGPSGTRSEPPGGWEAGFDIDASATWTSRRGWYVVRLDGFKGENVIEGHTIFPGLQTRQGIQKLIENAGGHNSPGYFTMARASFPPSMAAMTVITQASFDNAKGEFIFLTNPIPCAGADLALEGGDAAEMAVGDFGYAIGYRKMPTLKYPMGEITMFKGPAGEQVVRPALQLKQMFKLERGDTIFMASQIRNLCEKLGILPGWLCVDRTGNGQGVFDTLKTSWGPDVIGVNGFEGATERKILEEDDKTAREEYDRMCSELYFAAQKWLNFHVVKMSPGIDFSLLGPQLTERQFWVGKLNRVESKKDYKARHGGKSPDQADAFTLLVHAARKASGEIPSMRTSKGTSSSVGLGGVRESSRSRVDPTNRLDSLDD